MPVIIRSADMKYKDSQGRYIGVNAVAERATADMIADIEEVAAQQRMAIEEAGAGTIEDVEQAVADSQAAVAGIDAQRETMIAAIASVAGQGTDSTFTQPGVAADAAAVGALKSAIDSIADIVKEEDISTAVWAVGAIATNGNISTTAKYGIYTTPIKSYPGNVIKFTGATTGQNELTRTASAYFYNGNTFISRTIITNEPAIVPLNTTVVRFFYGYLSTSGVILSDTSISSDFSVAVTPLVINKFAEIDGSIAEINDKLHMTQPVDFSEETIYNYLIGSGGTWAGGGTRYSYNVPVPPNAETVTITANSNATAYYSFLTSNVHLNGNSPDYCTGVTGRMAITSGATETINVPADCTYVYVFKNNSETDQTPSDMYFVCGIDLVEIVDDVEQTKADISDIREEIADIQTEPSQIFNVNLSDATKYGIFLAYDGTKIGTSGYTPATGWENRAIIDKYIVCDDITYRANISLAIVGTGACVIGTQSLAGSASHHATLVKFDFENALVSFLTGSDEPGGGNIDGKTIPAYTYESFALENLSGTEYRIEIGRIKRCPYAKVYNLTTGVLCGGKVLDIYDTSSSYGGKAGVMYDIPNFGVLSGTITFKRVSASVPTGVFAVFIGDSITEGSQVSWSDTWANKSIMYLGSGVNCGRGSGTISHALRCASDILPAVKPKYVIVTIGTNGTPTDAQFANLIELIQKVGAIPIVNRIPMNNRTGSGATSAVNALVSSLGLDGASFDVATAINNDPAQGQNESLFNSDKLHPNAAGGTAMYNQFIADLGWIKSNDWE